MPTTTRRKPSTSSTTAPPKKKLRQTPSIPPPPPQIVEPSSVDVISTPPPAAPVLSAVAARRAAAAAAIASANTSAASSSRSTPIPYLSNPSTIPQEQETELQINSEASECESDDEATLLQRDQSRRKGKEVKGKRKEKEQKPSRYFSGPAEEEIRLEQSEDGEDMRDSRMVSEDVREPATPKGARPRRRREKTAFVDSECYSNFRLEESSNTWSTNVTREDGSTCEGVVYGLRIGEDLVIHGTFEITPLSGSFSLLGSTVSTPTFSSSNISLPDLSSSTSHVVHCPASHPLPPIAAIPNDISSPGSSSLSLYLDAKIDISGFATVVLVTSVQTGIEGIEMALKSAGLGCANGMYPSKNAASGSVMGGKGWKLILEPLPGLTILRQLESWTSTLAEFVPKTSQDLAMVDPGRLTVMVEGPKRVGKSTFAKMLLNRLLDRYEAVAYLDTDLGQPEFSIPGFVSLNVLREPAFGPAFTHLSLPISSHYLGSASPASDPTSYISAISALLSTYALEVEYPLIDEPVITHSRRRHRDAHQAPSTPSSNNGKVRERVPLVINTQGWVKGLGADLLTKLKAASQPTHVCSFVSMMEEENGGYSDNGGGSSSGPAFSQRQAFAEEGLPYHLYTLPAAPMNALESKWTASDYRTLSFTSYFHSLFKETLLSASSGPTSTLPDRWDFSSPLIAQTPYSLDWNPSNGQISSVHLLDGDDVAYEHVLHCLNGSLVAIVESTSPSESTPNDPSSFPYDPLSPVPHPSTSRALGLGLIRSISPSSTSLHLLTPIPPPSTAISLVKGSLEVPLTLMLDHTASESEREQGLKGENWREVPFLSIEEGEGAGRRRVRRNLMRRGHA